MLVRLRLRVPDRPGSLGTVASTLGAAGADIVRVDVLESESGRAVDDVFVQVGDGAALDRVLDRVAGLSGVQVVGVQRGAPPQTGHAELELVDRIVTRPVKALQTLVDGAPSALGADWAAVVDLSDEAAGRSADGTGAVIVASTRCPGPDAVLVGRPLRLRPLSLTATGASAPYGGAALVPVKDTALGLVLVREHGPEFHRAELWRLGQIGEITGAVLAV